MSEVVPTGYRFRNSVPSDHQVSIDTRIAWMWNQRFGTVQQIYIHSKDLLDKTAATLVLQAIFGKDLEAIAQILHRIEGSAVYDFTLEEQVTRV